uniref:Phosphate-regulating neutral endopeptidase (inferred by orthology to a human protein) n=1 Tax=Strongyloides venezuelensis TaxID=75913 RepID=A0A0K0FQE4_STRVS
MKFVRNFDKLNLTNPSFSKHYPNTFNFGYFGYAIAHEILHSFDSENYNRTLEEKSIENFGDRSDCFVKQYGMQENGITNKNISDSLTLVENIPDNGGIKIAQRVYMKYLQSDGGKDLVVLGFEDFTNEQLFFISFEEQIKIDEHPPAETRTNVALSNYKPFSDAFKCKLNSNMNPEDKCELWKNQKQN